MCDYAFIWTYAFNSIYAESNWSFYWYSSLFAEFTVKFTPGSKITLLQLGTPSCSSWFTWARSHYCRQVLHAVVHDLTVTTAWEHGSNSSVNSSVHSWSNFYCCARGEARRTCLETTCCVVTSQVGWARRGPSWGGGDQAGRGGDQAEAEATKLGAWARGRAPGNGAERLDDADDACSWRRGTAQASGGRRRHELLEEDDGTSSWRMGTTRAPGGWWRRDIKKVA